jgi:hypothetical protein
MEEIKEAMFGMEPNKYAGPDGFNTEFFQDFWDDIKGDLFNILDDLYNQNLKLDRINYGIISLVPKGNDADRIQRYQPICLPNVILKIVTKIICNRLIIISGKFVKGSQMAFIKGRYILDGVVCLHPKRNS